MMKITFERLPMAMATALMVLAIAACAIRLRGDESPPESSTLAPKGDAAAAKLNQCRTVTYEQKDALLECQNIWADQRSRFLGGRVSSNSSDSRAGVAPSPSPVPRKDESRLSPGYPPVPSQSE
ncbi:putative entry exclusion protein TrbK-alt [Bradyrhizobium sp. B124]|uniref:putative entry exclusion protein TrbK-alt n=1 Tax=Bradyrhizobium sp. B124 TaxID=3140245 RepID=UPI003183C07A